MRPRIKVAIFVTCWVILSLHWSPWLVREHIPAWALAESGTLNIERYQGWVTDEFTGPRGGVWINNHPGASLVGALPLLAVRPWLGEDTAGSRKPVAGTYLPTAPRNRFRAVLLVTLLTAVFVMAPVSALAAVLLASHLAQHLSERWATFAALLYTFATPVFFRSLYLNHNLLVAQLGLIAFLLIRGRELEWRRTGGAGLLAGAAFLCDFTGAILCAILAVWLAARAGWRSAIPFAACALPGVAALIAYQAVAFGDPFLPAQHYMEPTAPTGQGYRGFAGPSIDLAWANLTEPRWGLIPYCPLLLVGFAAPFLHRRWPSVPVAETRLVMATFALFFVFCSANQYSWLQWTTGFRYLLPAVCGLLLLSLQVVVRAPAAVQIVVLGVSLIHQWFIAMTYHSPLQAWQAVFQRGLELSWVRELRLGGFCQEWYWSPYVLFGAAAALLIPLWRRALR